MVLCDDCNSNGSKYNEYVINESFQYEQEHSTSEIEGDEDALTGHAYQLTKNKKTRMMVKSIMIIAMTSNNLIGKTRHYIQGFREK